MMSTIDRRDFIKHSVLAATAVSAGTFSINALGANERIVLGLMGSGGRGSYLGEEFCKLKEVELRHVADADGRRANACCNTVEKVTGKRPELTQDFRRILEDKEVDGLINATPDHWHALGTILACQAGKDVYVEKPTSQNIWESRQMINAARKYKRVVQVGAQNRSSHYCPEAVEYIKSGAMGDVHYVRVLNSKIRETIGKKPDTDAPNGVDYDMWLGPAPLRKFNENHFHYAWHWFWNYSGGDIINDGVHQMDIARWLIGRQYPKAVSSAGGIHYFNDDQETPDTQTVNYEFDGLTMSFEQIEWAPYMTKTTFDFRDKDQLPDWPFNGTRVEVYGTKEVMYMGRHGDGWQSFTNGGKSSHIHHDGFTSMSADHRKNFLDCIRTRKEPNADIEQLHYSTLLCHYGNISYRTGRRLHIDPKTEGFVDDAEANALVKRTYRAPWTVPDEV